MEELLEFYLSIVDRPAEEYFLKKYKLSSDIYICLKQSKCIISHGSTGLSVWEASTTLIEYIFSHFGEFEEKTVLELGSGTGICGLFASFYSKSVTLTDFHPKVLELLKENVELQQKRVKMPLIVSCLDWNHPEEFTDRTYDIVIASDVVYDPDILDSLIETLLYIQFTKCFLSCTERNLETFKLFNEKLSKHFAFNFIEFIPCFYPPNHNVKLMLIQKQ